MEEASGDVSRLNSHARSIFNSLCPLFISKNHTFAPTEHWLLVIIIIIIICLVCMCVAM